MRIFQLIICNISAILISLSLQRVNFIWLRFLTKYQQISKCLFPYLISAITWNDFLLTPCSLFLSDAPPRWLCLYLFVILFAWVVKPLNCWSLDQLYQPILNASLTWCLLDRTFIFDLFSLLLSWNWNFSSLCWHRDVSALSENFNFYIIIKFSSHHAPCSYLSTVEQNMAYWSF